MSRRDRRFGKQVFNQFFLRENYLNQEAFENAIEESLKNPYWNIGHRNKAQIKILRNRFGARVIAYMKE